MVSAIWNAASEGNLDAVKQLLQDGGGDVEIKDHTGATPLIQAVSHGHADVVSELLKPGGVSPWTLNNNGAPPESFTQNENILSMLAAARDTYPRPQDTTDAIGPYQPQAYDPSQGYYRSAPPPGAEHPYPHGYYIPEGQYYYLPQPPMPDYNSQQQQQHHSPPENGTKPIPCRYYPHCRYGAQCNFAHPAPPPGFYAPPPMPPHPFAHYDPNSPYPPFYPAQPNYPQHPMMSPPPASSSPDAASSPTVQTSESQYPTPPPNSYMIPNFGPPPNGAAPPAGYIPVPYPGSASGVAYAPFPYSPPSPTHHQHTHHQQTRSRGNSATATGPGPMPLNIYHYPPYAGGAVPPSSTPAADSTDFPNKTEHPNGNGDGPAGRHSRDNSFSRRPSRLSMNAGGPRKNLQPCMFFPTGKCRNGNDCRFQHIIPEEGSERQIPYGLKKYRERGYSASGIPHDDRRGEFEVRYPQPQYGVQPDKASIAQALASLPSNTRTTNLSNGYRNGNVNGSNSGGPPARSLPAAASASTPSIPTGPRASQQRVFSAADFPSLGGTRSNTGGPLPTLATVNGGKTAAQILKSSPPTPGSNGNGNGNGHGVQKFRSKESSTTSSSSASATSEKHDADSLNSAGSDQITRPTSPEGVSGINLKPPPTSTIEVPSVLA